MNYAQKHSLARVTHRLAFVWLMLALPSFLLIFFQVVFGKYGQDANQAWLWIALHLLPAFLLLLLLYRNRKSTGSLIIAGTDRVLYRVSLGLTIAYLLSVLAAVLLQPFGDSEKSELEKLRATDTGLFIFQGILIAVFLLFLVNVRKAVAAQASVATGLAEPSAEVFISYHHADKQVAEKLKASLEKADLSVIMDSTEMQAGAGIREFIEKSVLNSRITISIISRKSLLSGWVGMETINTFYLQKFSPYKKFIACYVEDGFLALDFTAEAVRSFNTQLEDINRQIQEHHSLGIDTRDLNEFKSRLHDLRNNMDLIIGQLRNSLCIDIEGEQFEKNLPLLLRSINADEKP